MPVGEPWILIVFAILYSIMIHRKIKKSLPLALLFILNAALVHATDPAITDLVFSTQSIAAEDSITVMPVISSGAEDLLICWEVFEDAACSHKVNTPFVHETANTVRFAAPKDSGTYYVRTSLHYSTTCHIAPFTSRTKLFHVYPGDADIVLARDHQNSGEKLNLRADMPENKKVYGVLRFAKTTLNDELLSPYQRYNYFISFPFNVRAGDICGFGTIGTDWRILYYDGLGRAQEGFFVERTDNWVPIDDTDDILQANEGYLLQLNYLSMDASNDDIWGNRDYVELYFPAQTTITNIEAGNETIPALTDDYRCTIDLSASLGDEGDRTVKDSYWRCIGTPSFAAGATTDDFTYLYQWDRTDNSLDVVSSKGFAFLPTHAYLVQASDAILWTNVYKPASIVARQASQPALFYEFQLNILQDETSLDHTFVRISEDERVSADFDFGRDLSKELNAGTNLYTKVGHERLAGNCLPAVNEVTVVPIGVRIAEQGSYTFSMPDTHEIGVTFVDTINGTRTNMAESTYTITLDQGTHDDRFWLEIAPVPQSTTGLTSPDNVSDLPGRKLLINGHLLIEYHGQLFDARGVRR